jgi:hypothetical protein
MAPAIRRVERRACKSVLKLGPQLFRLICFCDSAVASLNNKSVVYDAGRGGGQNTRVWSGPVQMLRSSFKVLQSIITSTRKSYSPSKDSIIDVLELKSCNEKEMSGNTY